MFSCNSRELSNRMRVRLLHLSMILFACLPLTGCAGPAYLSQAIAGHLNLMAKREDVSKILQNPASDPELVRELELAAEIRQFADTALELPAGDSYTQLVLTRQEAVTWNVVAAPEFSLQPRRWCFMISGCVPYLGYFRQDRAEQFAEKLAEKGFDVNVSPVKAYSTLGWFDDPLLDTMLRYSDAQLASLMFHELAHQKLYVKGDTAFNESYASFVAEAGVSLWLQSSGRENQSAAWQRLRQASLQLNALLQLTHGRLKTLYSAELTDPEKRTGKIAEFNQLRKTYADLVGNDWGGHDYFRSMFEQKMNNAHLVLINSYQGGLCSFAKLLDSAGGDFARFQELARDKAKLNKHRRANWLNQPCESIASAGNL